MTKYKTHTPGEGGWSEEVFPHPDGYKMACCDCGLVHDVLLSVVRIKATGSAGRFVIMGKIEPIKYRVQMKVRRNSRATAAMRRKR